MRKGARGDRRHVGARSDGPAPSLTVFPVLTPPITLIAGNVAEVIILLIGLAFRDADDLSVYPLSTLQILWINMVTSTPPVGAPFLPVPSSFRSSFPSSFRSSFRSSLGVASEAFQLLTYMHTTCGPSIHH